MADVNGFDPVPLSVDGGLHSAELFRLGLYATSAGQEGIISAGDCKVRQLTTPGGGVLIDNGALLILNRSAGVDNQTYAANGRAQSRLDVPPTGASGRSDLIVVRIEDEQYSPWVVPTSGRPTAVRTRPFRVANVPAGTTSAAALNLGYSALALARVDIPANTTNITDAMVKDVRSLAMPRSQVRMFSANPIAQGQEQEAPADGAFMRAGNYSPSIPTPAWATHATILAAVSGLGYGGNAGSVVGDMRISFGHSGSSAFGPWVVFDTPAVAQGFYDRMSFTIGSEVNISAYRGRGDTQMGVDIRRNPTFSVPRLVVVQQTNITLQVVFEERAI